MRKSISVSFFSTAAFLLIMGIAVMGLSEMYLVGRYFAQEKYNTLDEVADIAARAAGTVVSDPDRLTDDAAFPLGSRVQLIGETASVGIVFADCTGEALLASSDGLLTENASLAAAIEKMAANGAPEGGDAGALYHACGTLDGALTAKSYVTARAIAAADGQPCGYVFVCSPSAGLSAFIGDMLSNFMLSASLMLLCASILTMFLTRRLTAPLHKISEAARKFGGGDFSVRVEPMEGDDEVAQLAQNFNVMAANLQAIDNSRAQFMGNIAHELRTPMTTIKGFIDGMIDGTIPPALQNHYLRIVSQETGRLARLVQNMLDITKLESGEYQVHARLYNIWDTITGAALSVEQRITDGKIELEGLSLDQCLVYADPDLVHQVVYNLLDNAIKFTPAGGIIRFSAAKLGPETEISVWNSGEGISEDALPFVFERFYKEDKSRGLNARGSGLGLHICKVLVNLSGGQLRVESKAGEWCRFVFTLPSQMPSPQGMLKIPDQTEDTAPGASH